MLQREENAVCCARVCATRGSATCVAVCKEGNKWWTITLLPVILSVCVCVRVGCVCVWVLATSGIHE